MNRVIALGFFDGVHLGHGALLSRTAQLARASGCSAAALTFDRSPGKDGRLLTSVDDRVISPVISAYLIVMGIVIFLKIFSKKEREPRKIGVFGYCELTTESFYTQDLVNLQYTQFITTTTFHDDHIIQHINQFVGVNEDGENMMAPGWIAPAVRKNAAFDQSPSTLQTGGLLPSAGFDASFSFLYR